MIFILCELFVSETLPLRKWNSLASNFFHMWN